MSSNYKVKLSTIFSNGVRALSMTELSKLLDIIKNGHLVRSKEWVESPEVHYPDYGHPFRVTNIRFNKKTGDLEFVELKEMAD